MQGFGELLTARRNARLKFLEQESEQLRSYKSDLEFCLINTKRLLSEILSAQVVSYRRVDSSADTEFSSHAPLRSLETALEKNLALLTQFKNCKKERDMVLGKVLISEQLAEETIRKEHEVIKETEDHTSDINYVLEKKSTHIANLKLKIDSTEQQLARMKNESIVILPLSEENLNLYKQTDKVKSALSKISRMVQINELQTEELAEHYENLSAQLAQYKVFVKNPLIRNKKTNQALDMTLQIDLENSSSSSEVFFPDKLQIQSTNKPKLPKLDFTKVLKPLSQLASNQTSGFLQLKTKTEYLEKKCKEKTDLLNDLRQQIKAKLSHNSSLAYKLVMKKSIDPRESIIGTKPKRKRALSNTLDYLTQIPQEMAKVLATEGSNNESIDSEISFANISSFCGSEVAKLDFQEPDSILAEYMHEIIQD